MPLEAINKELSRHESNSQQAIIMEISCEESCCSAGNNQAAVQAGNTQHSWQLSSRPLTSIPVSWHPSQQHPSHNFPPHGWFPMSPDPTASQALHFPASRPLKRLLPLPRLGLAFFLKTNIEVISFPQSLIGILFHPKWLSRFTQLEFVHLTLPPKAGVCSV